jgi:hypothetical protein
MKTAMVRSFVVGNKAVFFFYLENLGKRSKRRPKNMAASGKNLFGFEDTDKREERKAQNEEDRYGIQANLRAEIVSLRAGAQRLCQQFELSRIYGRLKCLGDVSRFANETESIKENIQAMLERLQQMDERNSLEHTQVKQLVQMQCAHARNSGFREEVREQWIQKARVCREWMERLAESVRFTAELLMDMKKINDSIDIFSRELLKIAQSLSS